MSSWTNYLKDFRTEGSHRKPDDPREALEAVRRFAADGRRVRAVGSGHSSADVAQPEPGEAWMDLRKLSSGRPMPWPYARAASRHHVRVLAGTTIERANEMLAAQDPPLALHNMGNYDGQTLAGALSTGTHGSGLTHMPLCDRLLAVEMVVDERVDGVRVQRLLRIEPTEGITDADRFRARRGDDPDPSVREMDLEQDDEVFAAVILGLGCFGIITALTLEVRDGFWLEEVNTFHDWPTSTIAAMAAASPEFLQLTIQPRCALVKETREVWENDGWVTREVEVEVLKFLRTSRYEIPARGGAPPKRRNGADDLLRVLGSIDTGLIEESVLRRRRKAVQRVFDSFERRAKPGDNTFSSRSDLVLINSLGPHVSATSIDIWVPLGNADAALHRIVELANADELNPGGKADGWFHSSPVGIRIVGESHALIAPSFDGPKASFELPLLVDVNDRPGTDEQRAFARFRDRMLHRLEDELTAPAIGGRPHWGQRNRMTDAKAAAMYGPRWTAWKRVYRRFNEFGTFDNAFTRRMGLSA